MDPNDLFVECIKDCVPWFQLDCEGIDRMIAGPIELYGSKGIHPIQLITEAENYYMLIHDEPGERMKVVGYAKASKHQDSLELKEFEIFQEYRGQGYGIGFVKKLYDLTRHNICIRDIQLKHLVLFWMQCPSFFFQKFAKRLGYEESTAPYNRESIQQRIDHFMKCITITDNLVTEAALKSIP